MSLYLAPPLEMTHLDYAKPSPANQCTKSEVCSFIHSRDIVGETKNQLRFVVPMLELATIDLRTKFEISTLTHYKDMKGDKNTKIRVVWGLGVTQGHRQHNHL